MGSILSPMPRRWMSRTSAHRMRLRVKAARVMLGDGAAGLMLRSSHLRLRSSHFRGQALHDAVLDTKSHDDLAILTLSVGG